MLGPFRLISVNERNGDSTSSFQTRGNSITIAVNPEVILMDEPCSALDPRSTIRIEDLIGELREKYSIIIVTHNMQQAARVSDYTAFMFMGELVEFGDTDTLFTNPRQKQTEDYITGRFG